MEPTDQHRIVFQGLRLLDEPVERLIIPCRRQAESFPDHSLLATGGLPPPPLEVDYLPPVGSFLHLPFGRRLSRPTDTSSPHLNGLWVQASSRVGIGDPADAEDGGRGAHGHLAILRQGQDVDVGTLHDLAKPVVDLVLLPVVGL